MSSRLPAEVPATATPDRWADHRVTTTTVALPGIGDLAMLPLLGFAVLVQLDAFGNRLSAALPVSLTEIMIGGIAVMTMLVLLNPATAPDIVRARGTTGARLIAALFLWAVFCWTVSAHRDAGLAYLIKLGTAIGPALCALVILDRPARLRAVLWVMIGAGLVSAVIVLVESRTGTRIVSTSIAATTAGFEGEARSAGGSDENPTTSAQMLLVSVTLALGLLVNGERRWWPVLAATVLLGAPALVLMSARSALIGLAAAGGLIALSFRGRGFFPVLVIGGVVAAIGAIPFLPPTLIDRFTAIGNFAQDPTLFRRVTYLRIGGDLIAQSPVWGVGPGNFPLYYASDAYRYMPGREAMPRELHNTFLDTATEYGVVGFLLFVALLGHALLAARRAMRAADPILARTGFAVAITLAGLLVACFFMPHKDMRYLWLMLALAVQCGRLGRVKKA